MDDADDLIRDILRGRACSECGAEIAPDEPCPACAEKRSILREVFPELYGDA